MIGYSLLGFGVSEKHYSFLPLSPRRRYIIPSAAIYERNDFISTRSNSESSLYTDCGFTSLSQNRERTEDVATLGSTDIKKDSGMQFIDEFFETTPLVLLNPRAYDVEITIV